MLPRRTFGVMTVVCALAPAAVAEEVEFTIDPAASYFTAGGTINGRTLGEQTPGSNRTPVTGGLLVDINRAANTVSIISESASLLPQPLPHRPGWNTTEPSRSVFGLFARPAGDPMYANIDSLSPEIGLSEAPLNGSAPRVPEQGFLWVGDGSLYYTLGGGTSRYLDLHGKGSFESSLEPVTLTRAGDVETLSIPLRTAFPLEDGAVTLSLDGIIVARRIVPEPSSAALLLAAGAASTLLRLRRKVGG